MTEDEAAAVSALPETFWAEFRVAPSGLLLVEDSQFRSWNGSFLVGALVPEHLIRYDPATGDTEIVISDIGRVRDVAQTPDGTLLVAIDAFSPKSIEEGRIVELSPAVTD